MLLELKSTNKFSRERERERLFKISSFIMPYTTERLFLALSDPLAQHKYQTINYRITSLLSDLKFDKKKLNQIIREGFGNVFLGGKAEQSRRVCLT